VASIVNTFPQAFLEVLHHSLEHVGWNCCHFFPAVLFQTHRCPWFLFIRLALEIFSGEEVLRLETLVPLNIEVPTQYPLSHNDRIVVFEIHLHSKRPVFYRPALHGNWNALSIARRALKDKFPTPTVPLKTVLQNRQVFLPDTVRLHPQRRLASRRGAEIWNWDLPNTEQYWQALGREVRSNYTDIHSASLYVLILLSTIILILIM
jgi:hypothetical protein